MRFTRLSPTSADELRQIVLEDIDAVSPGLRVVASAVPLPDCGTIDMLAVDQRGVLSILAFSLAAGAGDVARCVGQWSWISGNLGVLRSLMPVSGADLTADPRLILVACAATPDALRLVSHIGRPRVELLQAVLVGTEAGRGALLEAQPLPAVPDPPASVGIDPILSGLPPGEARSLIRRVIEELRGATIDGAPIDPASVAGAVDLGLGGRPIASLVAASDGLQVRKWAEGGILRVGDDAACRDAVRFITEPAAAPARPAPAAAHAGDRPARRKESPVASLTADEIAEFEKVAGPIEPVAPRSDRASVSLIRPRFVEN